MSTYSANPIVFNHSNAERTHNTIQSVLKLFSTNWIAIYVGPGIDFKREQKFLHLICQKISLLLFFPACFRTSKTQIILYLTWTVLKIITFIA